MDEIKETKIITREQDNGRNKRNEDNNKGTGKWTK